MSFPIIGITCCFDADSGRLWLHKNYADAVVDAGGVPIILPALISGEMIYKILDICLSLKIKKPVKHMQNAPKYYPTHTITIASDSLLNKILKCKKSDC
ncbi:gamma-glutamyl-gamma-aminobutyrate hydrolase family protein [Peptococcaceae bacterium]|nr:gamma-glutamyl-gamma-aminobutyrate hydrolase family protein [Peptococcaceae bacterium]